MPPVLWMEASTKLASVDSILLISLSAHPIFQPWRLNPILQHGGLTLLSGRRAHAMRSRHAWPEERRPEGWTRWQKEEEVAGGVR
eukprot:s2729_g4.t1